ncbi:hypothetical protein HOLleu_01500 [Holothuria leucospilota]|uniref:DUF4218 domain-containing protein n=1 Tax=Holothuria leucospilota TaxID=206669 RepID=A0A9Q1HGG7_HOLLE|nr:hypothetical protein HOLleu_01500 [Holothuria leucospilota]
MTYPYDYPPPAKRSQRGIEDQAIRLSAGLSPEEGVKDISPLLVLPRFDITKSFPVDYMHAVCEGVGEQLLNLWFDRSHHDKPWFVGNDLNKVDERIASISPPDDVTRLPRSPSQRAHWKASEFRSWILFYSLPVLKGVLPSRYLAHMLLFVLAVWVLLQESVTEDEISICEIILVKFVIQMKELYDAQHVSYNVHLLMHLADTVRNCGPLWSNSCFPFEGYNRKIKSLFHGTRYVQAQIAQNFTLLQILRNQVERFPASVPHSILKCIEGLSRGYPITVKAVSLRCENLHVLLIGNPLNYELSPAINLVLQPCFTVPVEELTFHKFSSAVLNDRIFKIAKTTGRRKNCYISYGSSHVGEIKAIVRVTGLEIAKVLFVISEKRVRKCKFGSDQQTGADASHICQISDYQEEKLVVKFITNKFLKCVTAEFDDNTYCMRLPNCIELD